MFGSNAKLGLAAGIVVEIVRRNPQNDLNFDQHNIHLTFSSPTAFPLVVLPFVVSSCRVFSSLRLIFHDSSYKKDLLRFLHTLDLQFSLYRSGI